ncbi:MAG: 30S ribosomal protein S6 [Opitutales bacterium]|nr:30S ribosomal protein S6 [Opitutales bacterium]MCH8539311.1 30S ribosomal protein S6 [Opitutales bacterium]
MSQKKNYRSTFILDTRGQEQPVEAMIEDLSKEITALEGEVTEVNNRGEKEFARTPDKRFTKGVYVEISFKAPALKPNALVERTRLNPAVNRVMTQCLD